MAGIDYLDTARLATGVLVEFVGESIDDPALISFPAPGRSSRWWRGHPGVVQTPSEMHVLVDWVGLEETAVSLWMGFAPDIRGIFAGLGILSTDEFDRRRRRVLAGLSPLEE